MTPRFLSVLLVASALLGACQAPPESPADGARAAYGQPVDPAEAVPVQAVVASVEQYEGQPVTMQGEVTKVCQKKGCWLMLDAGDEAVRVLVERTPDGDYAFTVPTDLDRAWAVVEGTLRTTSLSAAEQQHMAADAEPGTGAATGTDSTASELQAQPELQVVARGVLIEHTRL